MNGMNYSPYKSEDNKRTIDHAGYKAVLPNNIDQNHMTAHAFLAVFQVITIDEIRTVWYNPGIRWIETGNYV